MMSLAASKRRTQTPRLDCSGIRKHDRLPRHGLGNNEAIGNHVTNMRACF